MLRTTPDDTFIRIFLVFLRLGLTSFGGPIAHIGYFREEFVNKQKWISERAYADTVALCQFLPGPASSQVGMAVGLFQGGYRGAAAAWLGFTMPSAILMALFALGVTTYKDLIPVGALDGLKIVAVAVVAQAIWGMGTGLCNTKTKATIMIIAAIICLFIPDVTGQLSVIFLAGLAGLYLFKQTIEPSDDSPNVTISKAMGIVWLLVFFALLFALPVAADLMDNPFVSAYDSFYRAGSLVFGGGHVVLPLLEAEVVPVALVDKDTFLAGYGAAQAVPGPLFTFGAFLGSAMDNLGGWWLGGLICLVAIFTPSFLLLAGALPFWVQLRENAAMQAALAGVNAGVVGILIAALYNPVWSSAIFDEKDLALALLALAALMYWKLPPWLVVIAGALLGTGINAFL